MNIFLAGGIIDIRCKYTYTNLYLPIKTHMYSLRLFFCVYKMQNGKKSLHFQEIFVYCCLHIILKVIANSLHPDEMSLCLFNLVAH
jgi:hypothetical protein